LFDHVLVALDGSKRSASIVPYVTDLARRLGAAVTLCQVDPAVGAPASHTELQRAAAMMRAAGIDVRSDIRAGDAAIELLAAAASAGADSIALATHARRGADRLLMGSVADDVVRLAAVPVLVLRC
jgi:nucleotide-binding universal stress UspA family protein